MRFVAIIALVGVTSAGPAFAHEGDMIEFPEFNLRIKTDISDKGPARGAPMFLPVGMQILGPYLEDATPIAIAGRMADAVGGFEPPPGFSE